MLKIYKALSYVSVDGVDWREVYCKYTTSDKEPESQLVLDNLSFIETYDYLTRNKLHGVWHNRTWVGNKLVIQVDYFDAWDLVSYKHFNTMSYKTEYEELKDVSLDFITKYLSADECIQYLKERGITTCPMNF